MRRLSRLLPLVVTAATLAAARPAEAQFSPDDVQAMVDAHNVIRSRLNTGGYPRQPVPPLSIPLVSWNVDLAATAQAYASTCPVDHNPSPEDPRRTNASCVAPGDPHPCCSGAGTGECRAGENLFWSTFRPSPADAVDLWAAEEADYTYAPCCGPPNDFAQTGHYTQLVWESTTEIGCGIARCFDLPFFGPVTAYAVVCNYSSAGNLLTEFPYAFVQDTDGDGVPDDVDDCTLLADPAQIDVDHDGFGNVCDADFNDDGAVNFADLAQLKRVFFTTDAEADLNGDGVVNFGDLAKFKLLVFQPPGPSGLFCAGQPPCPLAAAARP